MVNTSTEVTDFP